MSLPANPWWVMSADGHKVVIREPKHKPKGDPCEVARCGLPARRHQKRSGGRGNLQAQRARRAEKQREAAIQKRRAMRIVAIDGEGQGRKPHVYTYMSAVDEHGEKIGSIANIYGLSTVECLEFLLDLEEREVFGFSLGYDFTMILKDLPDDKLYALVRPETRTFVGDDGKPKRAWVYWEGYAFDFLRRQLIFRRVRWEQQPSGKMKAIPASANVIVWDVFQFYQGSFVKALGDWKIGAADIVQEIGEMKAQRSAFDRMSFAAIQKYCDTECHLLAKLVRHLIEAHYEAGLPLRRFDGAGSTSSALLNRLGVKEYKGELRDDMKDAVMRGFFGGRFEISRVGPVRKSCFAHDISSAYPYAMTFLPCLKCGTWELVKGRRLDNRIREATLALVHATVRHDARVSPSSWGPFPFRMRNGTILFPLRCDGTWVWKDEYLAAKDTLWPGVSAKEAWVYHCECDHQPFGKLPQTYIERIKLGKDAAGIVLKLGMNGGYGKCAQSVGAAPFQSFIWAGQITSATRGQLLRAIAAAKDPANVLMLATDGVLATERLDLPKPLDTGTWEMRCPPSKESPDGIARKPLGGWEIKDVPGGVFLARPGIYWPLDTSVELKAGDVRCRGISRGTVLKHSSRIVKHFAEHGWQKPYDVNAHARSEDEKIIRFVGLRQGVQRGAGKIVGRRTDEENRPILGEWIEWPMEVTFTPAPKRCEVRSDLSLVAWGRVPAESSPYKRENECPETLAMRELEEIMADQPSGDLSWG